MSAKKAEKAEVEHEIRSIMNEDRALPVELDDKAVATRAKDAARIAAEVDEAEAALKEHTKHVKARLNGLKERQRRLLEAVREGSEDQQVSCEIIHDYTEGARKVVRMDTEEVIHERALTAEERQQSLPTEEPGEGEGVALNEEEVVEPSE